MKNESHALQKNKIAHNFRNLQLNPTASPFYQLNPIMNTQKQKSKAEGDVLLLKSDGTLIDGAGGVYAITPDGSLVGPGGVVVGATGLIMTPAGVAQNAAVSLIDGAILANGKNVAAGSKIVVKKQVFGDKKISATEFQRHLDNIFIVPLFYFLSLCLRRFRFGLFFLHR